MPRDTRLGAPGVALPHHRANRIRIRDIAVFVALRYCCAAMSRPALNQKPSPITST